MRVTRGRGEHNSEAQPETVSAARGRRREYSVVLPSVASGSYLVSWRLVLGIASCRMITALCPLESATESVCFDSGPASDAEQINCSAAASK